jgi:sensor histidine kinase YesM
VGFYQISADINEDIAKLKKENTELKRSLIKQLQAENRRLEKMILRASSPIETR